MKIFGREPEQARLTALLQHTGTPSNVLVLRGEAGVGKSTLLDWAAAAGNAGLSRSTGVQAEFTIAYAGLHRLVAQVPVLESTAAAHRTVLDAVGADGPEVRPAKVALAVLELLTAAAAERPLLLTVDDAQWLDGPSWSALAFVARRLQDDPVVLLMAMRDGEEATSRLDGSGLAELRIEPLPEADAAGLLDARSPGLRADLRSRVLGEAGGNPLGLVELAAVAGRYGPNGLLPAWLPLPQRLERAFAQAVAELPESVRTLLLVAAVNDGAGVDEVVAAATRLQGFPATADDLFPATAAGLIEVDGTLLIRFRHPLVRSALRQGTGVARLRAVHAALAEVLTGDQERRIWHRAEAASGPDEQLAAELTTAANAARRRGAIALAVTALERAAQLSENRHERSSRVLWAAVAAHEAGDGATVVRLLHSLENQPLSGIEQARLAWLREIFLTVGWTGASRMPAFVEIIERMRKDGETELALDSLVNVSLRCWWSNPDRATRDLIVAAAERLPVDPLDPRLVSVLALVAPLERGRLVLDQIDRLAGELTTLAEDLELLAVGASAVGALGQATVLSAAAVSALRSQGRLGTLAEALVEQATVAAQLGNVRLAITAASEARSLALETGQPRWAVVADLARGQAEALRGNGPIARELADTGERALLPIGAHPMLALVQLVRGVDALADGRYDEAYTHLHRIFDPAEVPYHPYVQFWAIGHLAEAAAGCGRLDDLSDLADELAPWAYFPVLGVALRYCTALLAPDDQAEACFQQALHADLSAWQFERARIEYAYGVWLRRQRRNVDSRHHLRAATATFAALGARPWSERARAELRAAGERVHRGPDALDELTPQELQIAELAATGLSNRDIGERLFLSPRTISTHLYRIFPKLGIRSRAELSRSLQQSFTSGDV